MSSLVVTLLVLISCFLAVSSQYFQSPLRKLQYVKTQTGTNEDTYFNDYTATDDLIANVIGVHSIIITYSHQVESIQVTYLLKNKTLYQAPRHGGNKTINPPVNIKLDSGEYVLKVEGKSDGLLINQLSITTYKPKDFVMKKYGPFGSGGDKMNFSIEGYVKGFYGRFGDFLTQIGTYHFPPATRSPVFGANGQLSTFNENPDTEFSLPVVKIKKLFVHHEKSIFSIQAQYQLLGGATRLGKKLGGGAGGTLTVVKFEDDEEILGVEGSSTSDRICQLTFVSRRNNISNPTLYNGPFGWSCSTPFSVNGNVLGFSGIASDMITALSFYYS